MQVQSEFVLNTSHDYKRTNRSLYIGNITRSRLSLPRTEMALRALPCGKILYVLMFILTALLLRTLSNAFSLLIQIYLYHLHWCPYFLFPISVNTCYNICNCFLMQNLSHTHTKTHTYTVYTHTFLVNLNYLVS